MTLNPCGNCLFGKQTRVSFSKSSVRKKILLELVYWCGPIDVPTLGGNRYILTFIDDASRKVWVFVLKTKDQVLDRFKQWHAMKCLLSDNGGEYTSKEFQI